MAEGTALAVAGKEGRFFNLQNFRGVNTKAQRPAIEDEQFAWLENFMPIGNGNLRTLASNGTAIYTASGSLTIIYMFFFNIATNNFAAVFLSDGTAVQVNTSTLVVTTISSTPNTFYQGGSLPQCAQWGNAGILIVAPVTNGYWAWDGTLYAAGAASPTWLNGGSPTTMPSGIKGTAVETYQSRAWICDGAILHFSGPTNGASFSGGTGGGSFTTADPFLKSTYTAIRQSNQFLYVFGDSSVNVISNVQTSGSPLATTFNNQNVDPQIGTPWPNSLQAFGRGLVFASNTGVYSLYGGAAQKVSDDLDGIFQNAQNQLTAATPTTAPSAALASIYAIRCYCLLMPMADPFTGQFRNVMAIWDGKNWFQASQDAALNYIATQEINSRISNFGTSGTTIFQNFTTTSSTLNKIIISRLWMGDSWLVVKQAMRSYIIAQDNSGSGWSVTGTIDCANDTTSTLTKITQSYASLTNLIVWIGLSSAVLQFTGAGGLPLNFGSTGLTINGLDSGSAVGCLLGTTLQSTSFDFTLIAWALVYRNLAMIGG